VPNHQRQNGFLDDLPRFSAVRRVQARHGEVETEVFSREDWIKRLQDRSPARATLQNPELAKRGRNHSHSRPGHAEAICQLLFRFDPVSCLTLALNQKVPEYIVRPQCSAALHPPM
jgi:hypothetical protein